MDNLNDDFSENYKENYGPFMQNLLTMWKNEKLSQHLGKYDNELVNFVITQIEKKEAQLKNDKNLNKFQKDMIELDIQRIKFVIKDYLRIRLMKIELYLLDILKTNDTKNLSQNEMKFVVDLINMKSYYFNQGLKKMNIVANDFCIFTHKNTKIKEKMKTVNEEIIRKPPDHTFVIAQNISGNNLVLNIKEIFEGYKGDFILMKPEEVKVVPLDLVKDKIKDKEIRLL